MEQNVNGNELHYLDTFNQYKLAAKLSFYVWQLLILITNFVFVILSIRFQAGNVFTYIGLVALCFNALCIVAYFILELILQKNNNDKVSNAMDWVKKVVNFLNFFAVVVVLTSAFFLKGDTKLLGWILGFDISFLVLYVLLFVFKVIMKRLAKSKFGNIQDLINTLNKK